MDSAILQIEIQNINELGNAIILPQNRQFNVKISLKKSFFRKTPNIDVKAIISKLATYTNIVGLDISNTNQSVLPNNIGLLSNLIYLNFSNNVIKELPIEIRNLKNLESIDLSDNQIGNIEYILGLPNLRDVKLKGNNFLKYHQIAALFNESNKLTIENYFKLISTLKLKQSNYENSSEFYSNDFIYPQKAKCLPDEIGLCGAIIDRLFIYNPLDFISTEISKLYRLQHITYVYSTPNQALLPNIFNKLNALKEVSFSIEYSTQKPLGNTFYNSSIEQIFIEEGKFSAEILDFTKVHLMKKLRELSVPFLNEEQLKIIAKCPNITSLSVRSNFEITIPYEMPYITQFNGFSNDNIENLLLKLPNLRILNLVDRGYNFIPSCLNQLQKLERLYINTNSKLTKDVFNSLILECKSLIRIELYLGNSSMIIYDHASESKNKTPSKIGGVVYVPSILSSECLEAFEKMSYQHLENMTSYVQHVFSYPFTTAKQMQKAFKLLIDDYSDFENPFLNVKEIENKTIYLIGKTSYFNNNQQQYEELARLKIKIVEEFDENVDYIFINNYTQEDPWEEVFLYKKPIIVEDFFKEYHLAHNESAFLINNTNSELIEQIFRLWQSEEDNIALILALLDGGGVEKKWLSVILAIYCYSIHPNTSNEEISSLAATTFDKYADSELLSLRKMLEQNPEPANFFAVNSNSVNKFMFSLSWSLMSQQNMELTLKVDNTFDIELLSFIKPPKRLSLTIVTRNLNFIPLFESLNCYELEDFYIEFEVKYKEWDFPTILFTCLKLETISINCYCGFNLDYITIPAFSTTCLLKKVYFAGLNKIIGIENLKVLNETLEVLSFHSCNLIKVPEFVKNCNYLKELNLKGNEIDLEKIIDDIPAHLVKSYDGRFISNSY